MTKVFAKDILELISPPFLGLWLLIVPLCLIYVAGSSDVRPIQIRALVAESSAAKPTAPTLRELLAANAQIAVISTKWDGLDVTDAMVRTDAQLAFVWDTRWRVFLRSRHDVPLHQLVALAIKGGLSLAGKKPWEVRVTDIVRGLPEMVGYLEIMDVTGSPAGSGNHLIVGVMGLTVAFLPFLLACSMMTREWERGTLATLLVVPHVSWWRILAAKGLVALFATTTCFFCMLIFTFAYSDIPPRYNIGTIFAVQFVGMATSTLLGLAASSLARSQVQVYFLSTLYIFCLVFLTGISFPIANAATVVRGVANALPLTFSLPPLYQWLINGLTTWPPVAASYYLVAQCVTAFAIMLLSAVLARQNV